MRCGREVEDGWSPGDQGRAPYASQTKDTFRVVEEAVYARVREVARWRLKD